MGATPPNRMTTPPTAGPSTRAPFSTSEFQAIAFARSSLPTRSTTKACRVGDSTAIAMPERVEISNISQTCKRCNAISVARENASSSALDWVAMMRWRRCNPIRQDAGRKREYEAWAHLEGCRGSQQPLRAGQIVDQIAQRDLLHERSHEGNQLRDPVVAKRSMAKRGSAVRSGGAVIRHDTGAYRADDSSVLPRRGCAEGV